LAVETAIVPTMMVTASQADSETKNSRLVESHTRSKEPVHSSSHRLPYSSLRRLGLSLLIEPCQSRRPSRVSSY